MTTCSVYETANFVGKRWTILVLLEIYRGGAKVKRYSEIKAGLEGITPKILSLRLKELEKEGMIGKNINAKKFPVACEYSLTWKGKEFINVIRQMKRWSLRWKHKNKQCAKIDCKDCRV